jgi:geranylgeranyl diphosphate synthase type II
MTTLTTSAPTTTRKLAALQQLVNDALQRLLPSAQQAPAVIHDAMRYCIFSGGKRFRPLVALGACEAVGAPARRALPVACAVELIHSYSLVHDDLPAMDNADERRGQPSCHRKYGEGNAILVGDALLTLAFECLSRDGTPNALAIIRTIGLASGTAGLIGGQVLDLQAISQPRTATERTLLGIAEQKTAALIMASAVAGALAGGGRPTQINPLRRYGRDVGLAFQLIDDVHDREGLAQAMGTDAAQAQAERLIARAVNALGPFGKRASILRQLAAWLLATR